MPGPFYLRLVPMSVTTLIRHYEKQTRLHVRVRDVRDLMVSGKLAVKARIMFYGATLDSQILRGFLHEYTEPAQGVLLPGQCADIYFDKRQPTEWQRLVC